MRYYKKSTNDLDKYILCRPRPNDTGIMVTVLRSDHFSIETSAYNLHDMNAIYDDGYKQITRQKFLTAYHKAIAHFLKQQRNRVIPKVKKKARNALPKFFDVGVDPDGLNGHSH